MSGLSWNISIPCDAAFGRRRLAELQPGVPADLAGFTESPSLVASSRNSHTEAMLFRLISATGATGLDHLAKGFDARTGKIIGNGPWSTLIEGDDLGCLVAGTQALLAQMRADPSIMVAAGRTDYGLKRVLDALHTPASTVAKAIAIYDERRSRDEGDDPHCLVALLQAHGALAWHARNHGMALFHTTWLY